MWNDPTDTEDERGIIPNTTRDPSNPNTCVKKFGPDIVDKFLKLNNMNMIVRSHQNTVKGEDRFWNGQLMTVSSCSDYCGTSGNAAGFMVVQKRMLISFKIIKPATNSKAQWRDVAVPDNAEAPSVVKRPPTPVRASA